MNALWKGHRWLLACCALGLSACVSTVVQQERGGAEESALGRSSVVTMGTMRLDPSKPSTLSWKSPIEVFKSHNFNQMENLRLITHTAIEQQISQKGYPLLASGGDFQMSAVLVLDNAESANASRSDLLNQTGVDPGLTGSGASRGKGSLVIELRQGHALRWRGAVQIYILPEYQKEIATQRIEHAVGQLLSTWP